MAAGDRETTLILKAADLSSQTIEKVLATAAKLLTFQETLNAKVASGTVRISEFNGSLNNILQVFTALAQMKLVFPETERLERSVAAQQARVEALKARAAEIQAIPEDERTRKQQGQLDRFTSTDLTPAGNPKGTIAAAEQRLDLTTARLQRNLDLERAMGVTEENRAALQAQINSGLERHTQELLRARNVQLEIIEANLRERDAQAELKRITEEVAAINRRAVVDTKTQEAALRELTSEANAFEKAMRAAFDAAARGADKAKGEKFTLDFGDATYENKKRADDLKKADQELLAQIRATSAQVTGELERQSEALNQAARDAKNFDAAVSKAFNAAESASEKAQGEKFLLDYGEAAYEAKQRVDALKKADQELLAQVQAISGRATEELRGQSAALSQAVKDAKAFDSATAKAFEAAAHGADRAQGEKFALDFGDATHENKQRADDLKRSDQELLAQVEAASGRVKKELQQQSDGLKQVAKDAAAFDRAMAGAFNAFGSAIKKATADQLSYDMQSAEVMDKARTAKLKEAAKTAQDNKDELADYLEQSRRKAADFRASLPPVQAFGEAVPGAGGFSKTTETVAAIDAIRDPAAAARQTFEGLRAEINKVNAEFEASPKRIQDASKATNDLAAAFNDLRRQAGVFDLFRQSEAETRRTALAMQEAAQKLSALERQQASATTVDENLTRAIRAQRAEVASSISAYNAANAAFARFKEAAQAAGLQTGNTDAQLKAFGETATLVSRKLETLDAITGKSTKSQPILFGLRGYELQNLGYQINDVVSGFAQGQQASQIFAQQSGQIFQIWERDIGAALYKLREMPLVLTGIGIAATVAVVGVSALVRALEIAAERRTMLAQATASVDPQMSVADFDAMARGVEKLGVSYTEAGKAIREFSQQGLTPDRIKQIVTAAALFSQVSGKTFEESVKTLGTAFTGTYDELIKFTSQWKFLRDEQAQAIRDAYMSGDAEKARALAIAATTERLVEAREKGLSPSVKAWHEIRDAAHEALDFIGKGATTVGNDLGGIWLAVTDKIKTAIEYEERFLRMIPGLGKSPTAPGVPGVPNAQPGPTEATSVPAPGQEAVRNMRDQAADVAGVNRDAYRRLFDTEAKFRDGQWRDAERLNRDTNQYETIPDGGKGIMQIVRSTFDELKKQFPDLIKGDVHDPESNLVAGALYFRRQIEAAGGDLAKGILAYKEGPLGLQPGYIPRNQDAREVSQKAAQGFAGSPLTTPTLDVEKAKQAVDALGKSVGDTTKVTQTGAIATRDWAEQENRRTSAMAKTGLTAEETQKKIDDAIKQSNKEVVDSATQFEKERGTKVDPTEIERVQYERRKALFEDFFNAQLGKEEEVERLRDEIATRGADKDKTNLYARLLAVTKYYDARETQVNRAEREGAFNRPGYEGSTAQQTRDQIGSARVDDLNRTRADVAAAIWDKFNSEQKVALDGFLNNIKHGIDVAGNYDKARQEVASRAGAREDARSGAIAALQGVPDTAETRALRARIESQAAIAARPPELKQLTQEAAQQTAQPVEEQFKALEEMMKGLGLSVQRGARPFSDALQEATTKLQQRLPELTRATNEAVAGLQRLIEGGATPAQIEEYKLKQQELLTRLQNAPKDILLVINVGLEDSQKELESLVKRYKDLIAKAVQLQVRGLTGAAQEALDEAEKVRGQIGPARDKLVGNARQAAKTPGLQAGEVASLEERADKASKEGDPQQLLVQSKLDQAKGAEEQIKQFQSSLREHQATEQQLLAKGLTTQTAYEAEMKRAYEETAAQAGPAIQRLLDLADAAEKAGASASKVAQLRDQAKLLRAELAYVPPLTQQIMTGFEQSFVSRGEQAFDSIAKAIGTAAVEGGKLKDVWRAIGNGFANMAAGILQDVAKIIIKYELLKVVKDALGVDPGAAGGSKSGGGTGVGGLGGALISALGGGGGAAGAAGSAASTFGAAGVEAGTMAGADAGIASLGFLQHGGGMVGGPVNMSRPVDLTVFHEAQRMHTGGVVGLAHDEVPMILQKNEEVLSKSDPRNRMNMGAQQPAEGSGTSIRNVLAVGDREIASAMNSSHGERVILNVLQRNAPTVKKYVG